MIGIIDTEDLWQGAEFESLFYQHLDSYLVYYSWRRNHLKQLQQDLFCLVILSSKSISNPH